MGPFVVCDVILLLSAEFIYGALQRIRHSYGSAFSDRALGIKEQLVLVELLCRSSILLFPKERAEKTHLGHLASQTFNGSSNKLYGRFHCELLILMKYELIFN